MHPVIQKAIHVKWKFYGKWDTMWKLLITLFYCIAWLVLAYHFPDERTYYTPWKSNGWKIIFEVLIIVFALYFLIEVSAFFGTCFRVDIYMFKVNNRNTRTRCEMCSKLIIKTPERRHWHRSGVFFVNFEHIPHLVLVFLLLTSSM